MNYVTQIVQSIRVPNVNEVEKLHKQLKNDNRFDLKKFEYQHKEVKQKGEVVDEYELVKATMNFNSEKEPTHYVGIEINLEEGVFPEVE
jgi:hypothetical protein